MDAATLLEQPFSPPPLGVIPNHSDPATTGRNLTITTSIFLVITTFFVSVRAFTKLRHARNVTWDDYVLTGYLGYHSWDVTVGQVLMSDFFKISYAQQLVAPLTLLFIKLSFFILYSQIFRPLSHLRFAIWLGAIVVVLFYTLVFVLNVYFATPRAGETFATHYNNPISARATELSVPTAAIGLVFDLYIIVLPIYGIWQLQLSTKKKYRISVVFLTGAFACICAMLTLNYRVELRDTNDILRVLVPTLITTLVEMMIGVICTCAPAFNKAFQDNLPQFEALASRLRSSFSSSKQGYSKSYTQSSGDYASRDSDQNSGAQMDYSHHRMTSMKASERQGHELRPASSFQTSVGGGDEGFTKHHGGIHKKFEITQTRTGGNGQLSKDERKWKHPALVKHTDIV